MGRRCGCHPAAPTPLGRQRNGRCAVKWITLSKRTSLLLLGSVAAAACADDESASIDPSKPADSTDAQAPLSDGAASHDSTTDAGGHDSSSDAAVDGSDVPACSKDGWCRVTLPA